MGHSEEKHARYVKYYKHKPDERMVTRGVKWALLETFMRVRLCNLME
jgi:hypothetical protein